MNVRGVLVAGLCGLTLAGCEPTFPGERGVIQFSSSLTRQSHPWTPAENIALGSSFSVNMSTCLFCDPLRLDGGNWTWNQQVLAGTPGALVAVGEGGRRVEAYGIDGDAFTVEVEAPASLNLHDPIVLTRQQWGHLGLTDGGPWPDFPDVGEEIVMGADAGLLLEIFALGANGSFLGSSALFEARSSNAEVRASPFQADGRLLELTSGPTGQSVVSVTLRDGGLERTWPVRVAAAEEVAKLELFAVPVAGYFVVRALATRADGGVFFEPPLEWQLSREVEGLSYWSREGGPGRERRDIRAFRDIILDGGVVNVWVHSGSASSSLDLLLRELPEPEPPPPSKPTGCGCTSVGSAPWVLLLGLMATMRGRRRVH